MKFKDSRYISPLELAQFFHEMYEKYAPDFGYETKEETKVFDPNSPNGRLMLEVCKIIMLDIFPERCRWWGNFITDNDDDDKYRILKYIE